MKIIGLDHLVITVKDIEESCRFYYHILGMEIVRFGENRRAARFGSQKINFHSIGEFSSNIAALPQPGSADLCFICEESLEKVEATLMEKGVAIELGPVQRTGTTGPILSIYIRDPDGNLIELANRL